MKTVRNFLSVLMLILLMSGVNSNLQAQGKGHDKKKDNSGRSKKEQQSRKDRYNDRDNDRHRGDRDHYSLDDRRSGKYSLDDRRTRNSYYASRRNDRYNYHGRYTTYNYRNRRSYKWAPVYGHRYNTRYIYYRDYNVYYDCYNDVFVTWTGRDWIITSRVPASIRYVDFRRTAVVGVDYWGDDFNFYLERRRPAYISISASF